WIQGECPLEDGNGVLLAMQLRVGCAQKVERIGVIADQLGGALKILERSLVLTLASVKQAEVVPGARVAGIALDHRSQQPASLSKTLQVEQCDGLIQARHG